VQRYQKVLCPEPYGWLFLGPIYHWTQGFIPGVANIQNANKNSLFFRRTSYFLLSGWNFKGTLFIGVDKKYFPEKRVWIAQVGEEKSALFTNFPM